jgi:large subunit ribosomal protein L24
VTVAEKFTPALAEPLRRLATRQKTATLRANVSLADSGGGTTGKIDLGGQIGAIRVNVAASATGKREAFSATNLGALSGTDIRLDGKLEADGGGLLLALVGVDRMMPADDKKTARLEVSASGPLSRELRFEAKFVAGAIDAAGSGTFKMPPDQPAALDFEQFTGSVAGSKVQGRLAVRLGDAPRLDGVVDADALDIPAVIAAAIGMPRRVTDTEWSTDPIAWTATGFDGRIEFKAQRATLASWLPAQNLRGVARFSGSEVTFENIAAELAKGRFEGALTIANGANGVAARLRTGLVGADLGALFPAAAAPPLAGRVAVHVELEGLGRSPAAFMGSMKGNGSITLEEGQLVGLNPDLFGAVTRAVELGIPTDGPRIREFVKGALDNARLPVSKASAAIGISAGQARLRNFTIKADGSELEATANVDLSDATIDALLTLNGSRSPQDGVRPAVLVALSGALPSPTRTIDTNLLTGWLTLRALDQRAKQLDVMEQAAREAAAAAAAASAPPKAAEPTDVAPAAATEPPATGTAPIAIVPDSAVKKPAGDQDSVAAPPPPPPHLPRVPPRADNAARPAAPAKPDLFGAQ